MGLTVMCDTEGHRRSSNALHNLRRYSTMAPYTLANMLPPQPTMMASSLILTIGPYRHRKDLSRQLVLLKYLIIGYIAAGTYGKVYKARSKVLSKSDTTEGEHADVPEPPKFNPNSESTSSEEVQLFAIKKFKTDNHLSSKPMANGLNGHDINGNEIVFYTGISQSAIREMSLCRELAHKNLTKLMEIILENKSIYMVFEFFEHDLLQIIHSHSHPDIKLIPERTVKSLIWQVLNGVTFLHKNWIFHRDLKPANIMVSSDGVVKIGDLGLARKFNNPLQSLYTGDKVVVTIWYRAPELLFGTRYYTPAIDLWAVGCILAELLSLRPIFKGEEAKIDLANKKSIPFQRSQLQKIFEILGTPTPQVWPTIQKYPDYQAFKQNFCQNTSTLYSPNLENWYKVIGGKNKECLALLKELFQYDPSLRVSADDAMVHPYFLEEPKVCENAFEGLSVKYPRRRIYTDDIDITSHSTNTGATKRHGLDEGIRKRHR
ncbi:Pkinase-domain-containing protein [Metschnikowia bicuspidata var. bicuspidata NRRL YB-4993]|uniref:Cyclin-dependent kinase 8 n=1 Tax=Metschnikowia bicuspidata var. bicuspidata NRRL YB-4993 TaxID=869754 RepID=A0A1A0HHQ8_9ASCO|nr:Pkinase-domain-containing protein [Metschnikowia bicuspidata var. bicuspidata NRRL YB-4993]OBA23694.1 Pkinase-domain-containing protein [Metschnikowia bicuspidata var. bicuspidata NRRL YB-4993]